MRVFAAVFFSLCMFAMEPVLGSESSTKTIRGFADLNFEVKDSEGGDSSFRVGEFDTYITGVLASRISFLSEVTYKYRAECDRDPRAIPLGV